MRRILITLAAFAATLLPVAAHAQICTPFTDVPASSIFCGNIQWMLNRGVTSGCGTNLYCPNDVMPRDQMAAFMNRLADKVVFQQGGNAFAAAGELGTTDNMPLEVIVNNSRVMRYEPNAISPNVIGGHPANDVTPGVRGATIGGGGLPAGNTDPNFPNGSRNGVTDAYGTIGGGFGNLAGNAAGTTIDAPFATVAGGQNNEASGSHSAVGGGRSNVASGGGSTVDGGELSTASGFNSTVVGGRLNTASGDYSTVAGDDNTAGGAYSTIAGGTNNTAGGAYSTVAGGSNNRANGDYSFAAGRSARASSDGCFVFGDASTSNPLTCDLPNVVLIRAHGGFAFWTAGDSDLTYIGARLHAGATAWVAGSDRRLKDNLRDIDPQQVLQRLLVMPITSWNLKTQDPSIRHMGPMAQDFRAAFGLGESELGINTLDADGVAFAAIQGLNAKLEAKVAEQARELAAQREELAALKRTMDVLVARMAADRIAQR